MVPDTREGIKKALSFPAQENREGLIEVLKDQEGLLMPPIVLNPTTKLPTSQGESQGVNTALVDKFFPGSDYSPAVKLKNGNPANACPDGSNYLESIAKGYTKCGGWVVLGECANGHQFAKEIFCGYEWCPVCGKKESKVHKRRIARWLPKAMQIAEMGYWVITVPPEKRGLLRNVGELRRFRRSIVRSLKRRGYARGLSRYHYFGKKHPGIFHPHLNILVEAGFLSKAELGDMKKLFSDLLNYPVEAHYSYTRNPKMMLHWVKYVTCATFLTYKWDSEMADRLYHFNNTHCWGNWKKRPVWQVDEKEEASATIISFLEENVCPWCKTKIKWKGGRCGVKPIEDVFYMGYMHIGEGYWALAPPLDEWGNLPEI